MDEANKAVVISSPGLFPSNAIAQSANPECRVFPNLACRSNPDDGTVAEVNRQVEQELREAGIRPFDVEITSKGEVPTRFIGLAHRWSFERAWYYYRPKGPGIPPLEAEEFHKQWGKQVRVEGNCGCPSPLEYCQGFAVGSYHIDTPEGLKGFVELLARVHKPQGTVTNG